VNTALITTIPIATKSITGEERLLTLHTGENIMFAKRVLALSAAIVLAGSSGAFAQTKRVDQRVTASVPHFNAGAVFAQSPQLTWNGIVGDAVIRDGGVIGRDPDPNVRLQMYRDWRNNY
jgi:hypothetical protein